MVADMLSLARYSRISRRQNTHEEGSDLSSADTGQPSNGYDMQVRNFLWRCKYIVRYNEDGKKSKSKGNYIWHIDAKKTPAGWEFRPFHRKIAGPPPAVAACGVMWSWTPHVWDPRANWQNVPVHYDSPALPSWLTWEAGTLSGIPPPDVQACEVEVIAKVGLKISPTRLCRA